MEDRRKAHRERRRGGRRHHLDLERATEVFDDVTAHLDPVAGEQLLEAVRRERGVHERVSRPHVDGARDHRDALACEHEVVDAIELLVDEVSLGRQAPAPRPASAESGPASPHFPVSRRSLARHGRLAWATLSKTTGQAWTTLFAQGSSTRSFPPRSAVAASGSPRRSAPSGVTTARFCSGRQSERAPCSGCSSPSSRAANDPHEGVAGTPVTSATRAGEDGPARSRLLGCVAATRRELEHTS